MQIYRNSIPFFSALGNLGMNQTSGITEKPRSEVIIVIKIDLSLVSSLFLLKI